MIGILTGLVVLEVLVTAAVIAMMVWRGLVDMKEEDQLILFEYEASVEREQVAVRSRANQLTHYLKMAGVAWSVLFVAIVGFWIVGKLYDA